MKQTAAHTRRIAQAVFAVPLAFAATGLAAAPACAATQIPTLTNDVGQPSGGAGWQLQLGIGLLVVGLLVAIMTLVAQRLHASRTA